MSLNQIDAIQENEGPDVFAQIKNYWALIIAVFLGFGYVFNYNYYDIFGIKIFNYASVTEMFFQILPDPVNSIVLSALLAGYYWIVKHKTSVFTKVLNLSVLTIILFVVLQGISERFFQGLKLMWFDVFSMIDILALYLAPLLIYKKRPSSSRRLSLFIIFIIVSFVVCGMFGNWKAKVVLRQKPQNISFLYNSKLIRTNNTYYYIGETNSTLFLYNVQTKATIVYKKEHIDSLVYYK